MKLNKDNLQEFSFLLRANKINEHLLSKRLIINLGKGGVGKSVVSAAMALNASKKGLKTLLIQLHAKDRISEYLNTRQVTDKIHEIMPNLFCVNINPETALKEYVLLQVKLEVIFKVVFKNRVVNAFLKAVPALSDLVMIGKVEYHVQELASGGKPLYDIIIVDSPPTGNGIFFLSVPQIMSEAAIAGPIKEHSLRMMKLLKDRNRCAINIISTPEEMPVSESIDAINMLGEMLNIDPTFLIINRLKTIDFTTEDEKTLLKIQSLKVKRNNAQKALNSFLRGINQAKLKIEHANYLINKLNLPFIVLPDLTSLRFNIDEIEELSEALDGAM